MKRRPSAPNRVGDLSDSKSHLVGIEETETYNDEFGISNEWIL